MSRRELVGFGLFLALDADQIIEDCVDVLGVDGRLVGRAHLLDFGLPLHRWQCRLIEHHVDRVAGEALVVHRVRVWPVREHIVARRQIDADGFQRQLTLGPRANRREGNAHDESDRQQDAPHPLLLRRPRRRSAR
jgi:hypothetical protein